LQAEFFFIRQLHFSNFSVNAKPNPSAAYKFSVNATFFFLTGRRTAYNYIKKQKIWYKAVQTKIKLRRKKKKRSVRETARTQDLMATFPTCVFITNH